jgi:rubrerythrin
MSEFAYFRFISYNMLTVEEKQHREEIITLTEQVLDANGLECDSKISKISEEQLREILEGVRRLRKRNKKQIEERGENNGQKEELDIVSVD